jgi:hypothetical protein
MVSVTLQVNFVMYFFFFFFFLVFCEIAILSFRRILFRFFILFKKKLSREKKGIWLVARARARARADFRFVRFGFWEKERDAVTVRNGRSPPIIHGLP